MSSQTGTTICGLGGNIRDRRGRGGVGKKVGGGGGLGSLGEGVGGWRGQSGVILSCSLCVGNGSRSVNLSLWRQVVNIIWPRVQERRGDLLVLLSD